MATTNRATTLVTGRFRGRTNDEKIQIGRVCWLPAVKVVTMISSKLSANASMPPVTIAEPSWGSKTYRNVCQPRAPRGPTRPRADSGDPPHSGDHVVVGDGDAEGGVADDDRPERETECSVMLIAERSAIPVMMPGRAIGSTMNSESTSRPKNRVRQTAAGRQRAEDEGR